MLQDGSQLSPLMSRQRHKRAKIREFDPVDTQADRCCAVTSYVLKLSYEVIPARPQETECFLSTSKVNVRWHITLIDGRAFIRHILVLDPARRSIAIANLRNFNLL